MSLPPPTPDSETPVGVPPLSPQPTVTPAAGEVPADGAVSFSVAPAPAPSPDPALAPPAPITLGVASDASPAPAPAAAQPPPTLPDAPPLAAPTEAQPAPTSPEAAPSPAQEEVAFAPGDIGEEAKTMTTKEAVKILRELLEEGEFQKVVHGATDVLTVDPGNADALALQQEAQVLLANPEEVKRLHAEGHRVLRIRKIVLSAASLLMMGALALEGWAFFGEEPVEIPPPEPITYTVGIKTDPVTAEGPAPFTVKFGVKSDVIPDGVTVKLDPGDGGPAKTVPMEHTYQKPGTYTAHAVATGPDGTVLSEANETVTVRIKLTPTFTATPGAGVESRTVSFTASVESTASNLSYRWTFGDQQSGNGPSTTHTYTAAGTYSVQLVVLAPDGSRGEVTQPVTVVAPAVPTEPPSSIAAPTTVPSSSPQTGVVRAVIGTIPKSPDGVSLSGSAPFTVLFSAGASESRNGKVTSVHWDFGDSYDSNEWSAIHTYTRPRLYTVTLTVSDTSGTTDTQVLTVNVKAGGAPSTTPGPVTAQIMTDVLPNGTAPLAITFDGTSSSSTAGTVRAYEWDFGDGSTLSSEPRPSHVFQSSGRYTVTLKATDSTGGAGTASMTVTVQ